MDWLQWPAMALTVMAAWCVASSHRGLRRGGFWIFLLSNIAWTVWGMGAQAYGVVVLQLALAGLNLRGVRKNDPAAPAS